MGGWVGRGRDIGSLLSTEMVMGLDSRFPQLHIEKSFCLYLAWLFFWKHMYFNRRIKERGQLTLKTQMMMVGAKMKWLAGSPNLMLWTTIWRPQEAVV